MPKDILINQKTKMKRKFPLETVTIFRTASEILIFGISEIISGSMSSKTPPPYTNDLKHRNKV